MTIVVRLTPKTTKKNYHTDQKTTTTYIDPTNTTKKLLRSPTSNLIESNGQTTVGRSLQSTPKNVDHKCPSKRIFLSFKCQSFDYIYARVQV